MPDNMLPLQEVSRELDIRMATLKRWLEDAGIEPREDLRDRRRRLVTRTEVDQLKEIYGDVTQDLVEASDLEARLSSLARQVGALETSVAALNSWLASVADNLTALTQRSIELEQSDEELRQQLVETTAMPAYEATNQVLPGSRRVEHTAKQTLSRSESERSPA